MPFSSILYLLPRTVIYNFPLNLFTSLSIFS
nr:MAG TPA: hypothetical protein [Caudoviricetes sp.]